MPPCNPLDRAATARLNGVLDHLAEIFPGTDTDALRQLMADHKGPSQLQAIVELVLSSAALRAHGGKPRSGSVAVGTSRGTGPGGTVPAHLRFRTNEYASAVAATMREYFSPLLHRSTITNVLAQHNHSFTHALPVLHGIAEQRARRWSFLRLFRRRGTRDLLPVDELLLRILRETPTSCTELNEEVRVLCRPQILRAIENDETIARDLNATEYEREGQLIECECCYSDCPWEDLACCAEGHFFCRDCLSHAVREGLYGQGGLRAKPFVTCISAAADPPCTAPVPASVLRAVISEDLYSEFEQAQISDFFTKNAARGGFVICPFCNYAEASSAAMSATNSATTGIPLSLSVTTVPRLLWTVNLFLPLLLIVTAFIALYSFLAFFAHLLLFPVPRLYPLTFGKLDQIRDAEINTLVRGVFIRRHGMAFKCKNPTCMRTSCTECGKEFLPFHRCYEQEEDRMRIYIERAMADAVKRTCPQCHVSFVKSEGCNKLVCVCGYTMCYICRQDIRAESYKHFCEHFRIIPGSECTECDKCDLYKVEDEAISIERAAREAEAEFIRTNGVPLGHLTGKTEAALHHPVLHLLESYFINALDVIFAK
ncbi:uncharacterized protein V1518DRAFT_420889 [Limtongia smithiae]|uniref:uncharacterized protein n=1 Tax=Limtongia smithiae TaxID=1125753 RepID=UPI0034CD6BE4